MAASRSRFLVLSVALAMAGCGGEESSKPSASSSGTATPASTPTATATAEGPGEKEWAAKVTAVCKRNQKVARELAADAQAEGLQGKALVKTVLRRSVPYQRRFISQLGKVEAPEAISEDFTFFVARLRQALPLLKALPSSIDNPKARAVLQAEFKDLAADTRPFAFEHGLKACLPDQS